MTHGLQDICLFIYNWVCAYCLLTWTVAFSQTYPVWCYSKNENFIPTLNGMLLSEETLHCRRSNLVSCYSRYVTLKAWAILRKKNLVVFGLKKQLNDTSKQLRFCFFRTNPDKVCSVASGSPSVHVLQDWPISLLYRFWQGIDRTWNTFSVSYWPFQVLPKPQSLFQTRFTAFRCWHIFHLFAWTLT